MGNILTKNKSDARNFEKVLSTLDNDIQKAEIKLSELRIHSRHISAHWLLFTAILWIVYSCYYFYSLKDIEQTFNMQILLALPVVVSPLIIFYTRKGITLVYQKRIQSQEGKLNSLRKQQRLKLEELKKQTAYYTTQSLIDRYDEDKSKKRHAEEQKKKKEMEENQRRMKQQQQQQQQQKQQQQQPFSNQPDVRGNSLTPPLQPFGNNNNNVTQGVPQQPRWYDKLADALIGEQGPETKYALICHYCCAHNGLVLPQEINDIEYTCPKCGKFNASRKSRLLNNNDSETRKQITTVEPPVSPALSALSLSPSSSLSSESRPSSSDVNTIENDNDNALRKRNINRDKPISA